MFDTEISTNYMSDVLIEKTEPRVGDQGSEGPQIRFRPERRVVVVYRTMT